MGNSHKEESKEECKVESTVESKMENKVEFKKRNRSLRKREIVSDTDSEDEKISVKYVYFTFIIHFILLE